MRLINDKVTTKIATKVDIEVSRVDIKTGVCTLYCSLYDASSQFVDFTSIELTKEEYSAWSSDDEYIWNLAATKLGVTFK